MTKKHLLKFTLPLAAVAMFASASVSNAALVKTGDFIYDTTQDLTFYDVDPGNMNWADANSWATALTVGGFSDWRLPSDVVSFTGELGSVTLINAFDGNVPFTHTQFTSNDGFLFWSSESNGGGKHFQIGNDDGFVNADNDDSVLLGVMAVRSGAVPEPGSLALLGLSGLALILRRRR